MTKYKEYLRAKGTKLECDFEVLPYNDLVGVATYVVDDGVVAECYHESTGSRYHVYNKYGEYSYFFDEYEFHAYVGGPNCDPEYIDFLYDTGCNKDFGVFEDMEWLYLNDEKVRIAFKHMKAGIMDYLAFYRWISDRYQKLTRIPAHS